MPLSQPTYQIDHAELDRVSAGIRDWWQIVVSDLDRLSTVVMGPRPGGWVRKGTERAIIRGVKYGAEAATLPQELQALANDTQKILSQRRIDAGLRAAAFYHVRFQNIHPYHNGNGRIGRMILAAQCHQKYGTPLPGEMLYKMQARADAYREAFKNSPLEPIQYDALLALLERITGISVTPWNDAALSFQPLFPSKASPNDRPSPSLVKNKATQSNAPSTPPNFA